MSIVRSEHRNAKQKEKRGGKKEKKQQQRNKKRKPLTTPLPNRRTVNSRVQIQKKRKWQLKEVMVAIIL